MLEEEKERLVELHNAVYHAEGRIDGEYTVGLYGNKYPGLDDIHLKTLTLLREYDVFLDSLLN